VIVVCLNIVVAVPASIVWGVAGGRDSISSDTKCKWLGYFLLIQFGFTFSLCGAWCCLLCSVTHIRFGKWNYIVQAGALWVLSAFLFVAWPAFGTDYANKTASLPCQHQYPHLWRMTVAAVTMLLVCGCCCCFTAFGCSVGVLLNKNKFADRWAEAEKENTTTVVEVPGWLQNNLSFKQKRQQELEAEEKAKKEAETATEAEAVIDVHDASGIPAHNQLYLNKNNNNNNNSSTNTVSSSTSGTDT